MAYISIHARGYYIGAVLSIYAYFLHMCRVFLEGGGTGGIPLEILSHAHMHNIATD